MTHKSHIKKKSIAQYLISGGRDSSVHTRRDRKQYARCAYRAFLPEEKRFVCNGRSLESGEAMTTDFKQNVEGEQMMFLDCPMCDFADDIVYRTKEPTYCSNACRQRAKRKRKKSHSATMERYRILDQLTLDTLNQLTDYDLDRLVGHLKGKAKFAKMNRHTSDELIERSMEVLYKAMAEYINVSVKATRIHKTS